MNEELIVNSLIILIFFQPVCYLQEQPFADYLLQYKVSLHIYNFCYNSTTI